MIRLPWFFLTFPQLMNTTGLTKTIDTHIQRRQENAKQVICTFRGYLHLFALFSFCRTKTFILPQMAQKLSFLCITHPVIFKLALMLKMWCHYECVYCQQQQYKTQSLFQHPLTMPKVMDPNALICEFGGSIHKTKLFCQLCSIHFDYKGGGNTCRICFKNTTEHEHPMQ